MRKCDKGPLVGVPEPQLAQGWPTPKVYVLTKRSISLTGTSSDEVLIDLFYWFSLCNDSSLKRKVFFFAESIQKCTTWRHSHKISDRGIIRGQEAYSNEWKRTDTWMDTLYRARFTIWIRFFAFFLSVSEKSNGERPITSDGWTINSHSSQSSTIVIYGSYLYYIIWCICETKILIGYDTKVITRQRTRKASTTSDKFFLLVNGNPGHHAVYCRYRTSLDSRRSQSDHFAHQSALVSPFQSVARQHSFASNRLYSSKDKGMSMNCWIFFQSHVLRWHHRCFRSDEGVKAIFSRNDRGFWNFIDRC